ncbi:hypothetical protein EJ04DRAFT_338911 [Polyplosphaeria fusca]|uniref:Uncharacterized protein n=1 Tax=Polyplosphaeria fusca TaxID=682080 RepID=A0A9P4V0P7_9PLEO|nr:hypothetical protein EJ04DRAFT_338911 [Polyplosphaeria fusca]
MVHQHQSRLGLLSLNSLGSSVSAGIFPSGWDPCRRSTTDAFHLHFTFTSESAPNYPLVNGPSTLATLLRLGILAR